MLWNKSGFSRWNGFAQYFLFGTTFYHNEKELYIKLLFSAIIVQCHYCSLSHSNYWNLYAQFRIKFHGNTANAIYGIGIALKNMFNRIPFDIFQNSLMTYEY